MNKKAVLFIIAFVLLSAASLFAHAQEYEYVSLNEKVSAWFGEAFEFFKGGGYGRHKNVIDNIY